MPRGRLRRSPRPRVRGVLLPLPEYVAVYCGACRESSLIVMLPGIPVRPHIEELIAEHDELHRRAV